MLTLVVDLKACRIHTHYLGELPSPERKAAKRPLCPLADQKAFGNLFVSLLLEIKPILPGERGRHCVTRWDGSTRTFQWENGKIIIT